MSIYLTTWKIFFSQLLTICKVNDYPGIMGVMVTIKLLYYLDFLIFKQFKHLYFKKCLRLQVTTNVNTFRNALVFFHIQYTVASQRKAMSRIYRWHKPSSCRVGNSLICSSLITHLLIAHHSFAQSLICSHYSGSGQMSECERFAQDNWANERIARFFEQIRYFSLSLTKNERFAQNSKKLYFLYILYSCFEVF